MAEELDEFPSAFATDDVMPWERPAEPLRWQWGADRGKVLYDIASRELLRKRRWLEEKNGETGHYFDALIQAIDVVLMERQGE